MPTIIDQNNENDPNLLNESYNFFDIKTAQKLLKDSTKFAGLMFIVHEVCL